MIWARTIVWPLTIVDIRGRKMSWKIVKIPTSRLLQVIASECGLDGTDSVRLVWNDAAYGPNTPDPDGCFFELHQVAIVQKLDDGTEAEFIHYRRDYGWDDVRNSETRRNLTSIDATLGVRTAFPALLDYELDNIKAVTNGDERGVPAEIYLHYAPPSASNNR